METNLEKAKSLLKDNALIQGIELPEDGYIFKMLELAAKPDNKNEVLADVIPCYFKQRRQKLNMSLQDVSNQTNYSKATICRIEHGKDAFYKTIVTLDKFYSDNGV